MKNLVCMIFCLLMALVNPVSQARGEASGMEKINIGKKLALYPSVVANGKKSDSVRSGSLESG